jgi:hypothetical protein
MLLLASGLASATPTITVCVVAKADKNPTYHGTATSYTRLKCELPGQNYRPTMQDLYKDGWRLVGMAGADYNIARQGQAPSPVYYFERLQAPPEEKKPGDPNNPFSGFFGG